MASEKSLLAEKLQKYLAKSDWKSAIETMEKLFAIDHDPILRVRIGDVHQKLNQKGSAVKEYVAAADLYADKGFVVKALAQYKLALRIDPSNKDALRKMESLHSNKTITELKLEPIAEDMPQPTRSVIPLFSDLTQGEFNDFTRRMIFQTIPQGTLIVKEGDTGRSVFVITRGSVRVSSIIQGKKVDLAVLQASDFFGEISFLTGKPRTATVEATEETDVLEVAEQDLGDLIGKSPRIREVLQNYYQMRVTGTITKVKEII